MTQFRYRAVGEDGRVINGQAEALNLPELESRLARIGLSLIRGREVKGGRGSRRGRVSARERIGFFVHMASLLRAGVPMIEALGDLRDSAESLTMRQLAGGLRDRIETGSGFSDALAAYPQVFGTLIVGLVRAGEVTGKLPEVLEEIVESLKWADELAAQMKKAVAYPAFVSVVVTGVVFFLMIYLVPQLVTFLQTMGQELPLQTRILIGVSDFLVDWWYLVLGLPVLAGIATVQAAKRNREVRLRLDRLLLRLPLLGDIVKKIALARFANTFGLLYGAGITVLDALRHCEAAASNLDVREGIGRARALIAQGVTISEAFATIGLFPPLIIRMLRVGESTGDIDGSLRNVSYFYARDVREAIGRLQSLIEPVLTVVLGAILGWMMLAVLGPIYDTISKIRT
ncbi:MAG: type II secretion system F family protein [Pseudomonadota bacterium]